MRSIADHKYFLGFYFVVDVAVCFIILYSSFVNDVSIFVVLSFSKTIMIIHITDVIDAYK